MVTVDSIVYPQHSVVFTEMNGQEVVLWHMDAQEMFTLNVTGIRIWTGIQDKLPLSMISQRLVEEFVVEGPRATASVMNLIQELLSRNLITLQQPA